MGSTASLPRGATFLRTYSPAVSSLSADRMKPLPTGAPPKPQRSYRNGEAQALPQSNDGPPRPPERFVPFQRPSNPIYSIPDGYMSSPERSSRYEDPYYSQYGTRSGSITPVIDEEVSDTELLDDSYSLYGVKIPQTGSRISTRSPFPAPSSVPPYDATRLRVENMERQLANLTGLVQKALTQPTNPSHLQVPGREGYRERDRLKPAPPGKSTSLSPSYDSRIYRDLQLTPEMYNQLRGLQKKAKDLRAEVRNLRRMSQAQAHSVKETIRDTFIKIRAMLMAGGEQVWQAGMDQERVRLTREEDLYKQEMLRLEKDLSDLESTVEELRGNVINRKTRVNMSDVENMALVLSKSSKTVADLKLRFPGLQDSMKSFLTTEMEKVMREETFLKEEPERLESALRRCKKLTGTLVTLKRLASVQEQRLPNSNSGDGHLSPTTTETPPVTPSSTHSKPPTAPRLGQVLIGGDSSASDSSQRPENALDALLDELQTFSKPHPIAQNQDAHASEAPAIPVKGVRPPQMSEIGRKGSMDSASFLPTQNLSVSTTTGSLRRLHSYPSGSDTDNSPPIQPLQRECKTAAKPPLPERNQELLQQVAGKRVPPPPPPRTSSKSPLASPTSPNLPPKSPALGLQHIQNVQNMVEKPLSQFEQATQNLGLQTLRRNIPSRSSIKDPTKSQTLPRNIGSNLQNLQIPSDSDAISASNSSSCESVNSQDGSKKTRKEELEQRHQELLKKQKALQEQYARLQQLQRGNNTLAVVPPAPDQLLKKTGSESNLLQKMGLQLTTSQITGSLTNLPNTTKTLLTNTNSNPINSSSVPNNVEDENNKNNTNTHMNKVYETDIL
ncbi:coiled-coil domain-containing protein AGAP005037-like isoform X5 [Diabrotica virgifera virgifera]|uniref:Actin interacting protein 3-like C-terminal domain-containing protein n=1 Tax=Diabrotica virgifera virgifera TaxID=50390 RepID=A0ABM5KII1_DIAVI|nr:coiled-coil domain-containing protein AGAP005037-like isoform X5 [Diabrotica virgifera virgifera]